MKISSVMETVFVVLEDSAANPDYLKPQARAAYDAIKTGESYSFAWLAAIDAGAEDDRPGVDQMIDYLNVMTDSYGNPGAREAFDEFHRAYGLKGIIFLYNAGYKDPQSLWDLYRDNFRFSGHMAEAIGYDPYKKIRGG